jgi:hypothetical protein
MNKKALFIIGSLLLLGGLSLLLFYLSTEESMRDNINREAHQIEDSGTKASSEKEQENIDEVNRHKKKGSLLSSTELQLLIDQLPAEEKGRLELGGPPPDGIPSIDKPVFIEVGEADQWLEKNEPVIFVQLGDQAKAYPMQVLMWHEIVNDTINGVPVTVTYCPLCNSSFTFKRQLDGQLLDFGTTGYLYNGALLMYDRQTHSLWAHFGGNAIGGTLVDRHIEILPSSIVSWKQFKESYPKGKVLSKETGYQRAYGQNPYVGYDNVNTPPFLFSGKIDDTLAPKERIVAIEHDDTAKAYLLEDLNNMKLIQDSLGQEPIVLFYSEGTASGLDKSTIAEGKEVGSTAAYSRVLEEGGIIDFYLEDGKIKDQDTQSTWNFMGEAIEGPLKGEKLRALSFKVDTFWFAWSTYRPDTVIFNKIKREFPFKSSDLVGDESLLLTNKERTNV